jgi:hypothetical protein
MLRLELRGAAGRHSRIPVVAETVSAAPLHTGREGEGVIVSARTIGTA